MKHLTRRQFIAIGTAGLLGCTLSPASAFANSETNAPRSTDSFEAAQEYAIEELKQASLRAEQKWDEAVEIAASEGFPVTRFTGETSTILPKAYYSPVATRNIGYWPYAGTLALNATYEASNNFISVVHGINSYSADWGCQAEHITGSWTKIDSGRTLAVYYTTNVTWSPGTVLQHTETIASYAEFYSGGSCWAQP